MTPTDPTTTPPGLTAEQRADLRAKAEALAFVEQLCPGCRFDLPRDPDGQHVLTKPDESYTFPCEATWLLALLADRDRLAGRLAEVERERANLALQRRLALDHACPNQALIDDLERWRMEAQAAIEAAERERDEARAERDRAHLEAAEATERWKIEKTRAAIWKGATTGIGNLEAQLDAAEQRAEAAERERDEKVRAAWKRAAEVNEGIAEARLAAESRAEALAGYVEHRASCAMSADVSADCTCGLDALLTPAPAGRLACAEQNLASLRVQYEADREQWRQATLAERQRAEAAERERDEARAQATDAAQFVRQVAGDFALTLAARGNDHGADAMRQLVEAVEALLAPACPSRCPACHRAVPFETADADGFCLDCSGGAVDFRDE